MILKKETIKFFNLNHLFVVTRIDYQRGYKQFNNGMNFTEAEMAAMREAVRKPAKEFLEGLGFSVEIK